MGKRGAKVPSTKSELAAQPTQKALDHRLLINVLLLVLTFIVLLNLFLVYRITSGLAPQERPQFEFTEIRDPECVSCNDIASFFEIGELHAQNRTILDYRDAQAFLLKYNITRVPAMIIKTPKQLAMFPWPYIEDAYVAQSDPPFIDPLSGALKGVVKATLLEDPTCPRCDAAKDLLSDIQAIAVVGEVESLSGSDAQSIIRQYGLTRLPALVLSGDLEQYPVLVRQWGRVGHRAQDGNFVLAKTPPPYRDVSTNQIRGLVNVTLIKDPSCTPCYDPMRHVDYLRGLGLTIEDIRSVDASSEAGHAFVERYALRALPSMIVSSEAKEYSFFEEVWAQLGTKESDGSFVFRSQAEIPLVVYVHLPSGELRQGA